MAGRLQREIKQVVPLARAEEAAANLHRTSAVLSNELAQILKRSGLSGVQFNILRILRGAGEGGLPVGEIGARLVSPVPDVTRLIERLERDGLVTRRRSAEDGRVVQVTMRARGLRVLEAIGPDVRAAQVRQFAVLSEADLAQLIDLLERLREGREGR